MPFDPIFAQTDERNHQRIRITGLIDPTEQHRDIVVFEIQVFRGDVRTGWLSEYMPKKAAKKMIKELGEWIKQSDKRESKEGEQ